MKCAVVDNQGIVVNIIVANPEQDAAPQDCILYGINQEVWVDIGWYWSDRIFVPIIELPPDVTEDNV